MKVRLTVSPGSAGFNQFTLRVTDYDTGATVHASSVQLEFTQPLRPQLGELTLTLNVNPTAALRPEAATWRSPVSGRSR